MTTPPKTHNELIQQEFTKQAKAYASNPAISDPDWASRLVHFVQPSPRDRVLEVATGPGYVAMAFARHVSEVVGVDLTDAPLALAEEMRRQRSLLNLRFEKGDASQLTFADATFDIVVCRLAFHHFADPTPVLHEMVRVCRPGGTVAVEDLTASENVTRAQYYNRWEHLRDPSHTVALSLGQLLALFCEAGLEVVRVQTENRTQVANLWMDNAQTPPEIAEQVWHLLEQDEQQALSGMRLFRNEDGQLCFDHRMATLVGQNFRPLE